MSTADLTFSEGLPVSPFAEELKPYEPGEFVKPEPAGKTKTTGGDSKSAGSKGVKGPVKAFLVTLKGAGDDAPPNVTRVRWLDKNGDVLVDLKGLSVPGDVFLAGATQSSASDLYAFWASLLVGDIKVTGSAGDDPFLEVGSGGKGVVNGRAGDDTLYVWDQKNVVFDGGAGRDKLALEHFDGAGAGTPAGPAVVDLAKGTGTNPFGGTLKVANVEDVVGVFGAENTIRGDGKANFILGGTAVDDLRGRGGDDHIHVKYFAGSGARGTFADGGDGKDLLTAELSLFDFVGSGFDIVYVNVLDLEHPGNNRGTFAGGTFANFEEYVASAGTQYERFDFRGSSAGEKATGSFGPDILDGRKGDDLLAGSGGSDRFVFSTALNRKSNVDKIADFVPGTDEIALEGSIFTGIGGALGKGEFRKGAEAKDGNDRIILKTSTGELFHDADGAGGKDQVLFAVLTNKAAPAYTDFVMV